MCVPRVPVLPLALLPLCCAGGLGRAVQRTQVAWIDLSLDQTIQNLKKCQSRSEEGKRKTHMHLLLQQEEEKAAAVPAPYSSEGKTVFGCTSNNVVAHFLPLCASTGLSLLQELKWSACQSPGTWLGAPFESDKPANRSSWEVSL